MIFLKKYPFCLFLLPTFFVLHGWVENYGFIEISEIFVLYLSIQVAFFFLFFSFYFKAKKNIKLSSIVTSFIGFWYLFFGAIVDLIRKFNLFFFSSYSFLLPTFIFASIMLFFLLKKKVNLQVFFFYYLNTLLLIFCIVDGVLLVSKFSFLTEYKNSEINIVTNKNLAKPNIYFMVFDEYAGYKSLNDSFQFRNDRLNTFLESNGFKMMPYFSNYDLTFFSVSSILNMEYIRKDYDPNNVTQKDLQRRTSEIRNGKIFKIFTKLGYAVNNYSIFDVGDQQSISTNIGLLPSHSLLLTDKILHNRIWRTSAYLLAVGKFAISSFRKKYLHHRDNYNLKSIEMLLTKASHADITPQLSYAHFLLPHAPFYRDSLGNYVDDELIIDGNSNFSNKDLYLSYLKYTNKVIEKIVDTITFNDPLAIVIIMSDHGFRAYNSNVVNPLVFNNIVALKLPPNSYNDTSIPKSNVNLFRFILNNNFQQSLPYLIDSSITLKEEK